MSCMWGNLLDSQQGQQSAIKTTINSKRTTKKEGKNRSELDLHMFLFFLNHSVMSLLDSSSFIKRRSLSSLLDLYYYLTELK